MDRSRLPFVFILIMISTSCCTGHLNDDPSQPAISANYMTAELITCGKRSLGTATCGARLGDEVELKVQGIYQGEMRAVSTACNLDKSLSYSMNELVSFKFPLINKRCLVTVTVFPDYPISMRNDVVVYGLRGVVAFRSQEGTDFYMHTQQTGDTTIHQTLRVPVKAQDKATVVLGGCGMPTSQKTLDVIQGAVSIPLQDYINLESANSCILDGFLLTGEDDITFLGLYSKFAATFSPLPIPELLADPIKETLAVRALKNVSLIVLDDRVTVASAVKLKKVNFGIAHILRLYTSKGRSLIGEWDPQKGEWSWMD